ncbi:MAG: UDP-N-acetylmuramoyl-L-alanyl-D-glutamate--2,6-diaminopimelate ligase [Phycisphaerales bacterium]|nr:UDP-N-acetylmuramoyl-L-alanyl-D-glutamate--2,6-diaminopimelate ligase [Phycisphaerales bacterium]
MTMCVLQDVAQAVGLSVQGGADPIAVCDVTDDNRQVQAGWVFIARQGERHDGRAHIGDALRNGAAAILTDADTARSVQAPTLSSDDPVRDGALLAHRIQGDPSGELQVVGITGTNGKSTCAMLVQHLMTTCGHPCGLIGGIEIDDGASRFAASLTTPPAWDIARLMRRMVDHGSTAVAMEASSQGIATGRLHGVQFTAGVFTNFSGDHLDLHGDLDTYRACKTDWMASLDGAVRVVNIDDETGGTLAGDVITVGGGGAVRWRIIESTLAGQRFELHTPWGDGAAQLPLLGRHNVVNAAQSVATVCALGTDLTDACTALATAPVPAGRLHRVPHAQGPAVFVDFAHTDGALHAVLSSVRSLVPTGGRLIVVFGCGGDRDVTKRPRMASVASTLADIVWVTSDNPRTENPDAIIDAILEGATGQATVHRCTDRRVAIESAVADAHDLDVIVIAGKGHEQVQLVDGRAEPFDDCAVALGALSGVQT